MTSTPDMLELPPGFSLDEVETGPETGELPLVSRKSDYAGTAAFSLLTSAHLLLSKSLRTCIDQLDPEVKELIADCLATPSRKVDVSIYDPRVFELAKRKMVKIHEERETEDGLAQLKYQIELEEWIYDFLKDGATDIFRTKRGGESSSLMFVAKSP